MGVKIISKHSVERPPPLFLIVLNSGMGKVPGKKKKNISYKYRNIYLLV